MQVISEARATYLTVMATAISTLSRAILLFLVLFLLRLLKATVIFRSVIRLGSLLLVVYHHLRLLDIFNGELSVATDVGCDPPNLALCVLSIASLQSYECLAGCLCAFLIHSNLNESFAEALSGKEHRILGVEGQVLEYALVDV